MNLVIYRNVWSKTYNINIKIDRQAQNYNHLVLLPTVVTKGTAIPPKKIHRSESSSTPPSGYFPHNSIVKKPIFTWYRFAPSVSWWRSTNLLEDGGSGDKFSAGSREYTCTRTRERVQFNAWLMTRGKGEQECSEARRKERERER